MTLKTWTVTDPSGAEHQKSSRDRTYTHAVIRRAKRDLHYRVIWTLSLEAAERESRVYPAGSNHIQVVTLEQPSE